MIVWLYYYAEAVEAQEDVTLRGLEESKLLCLITKILLAVKEQVDVSGSEPYYSHIKAISFKCIWIKPPLFSRSKTPIPAPYLNIHSLSFLPPTLAYSLSHFLWLLSSKIVTFLAFLMGADVPAEDRIIIVMAFVKAIVTPSFTLLGLFGDEEN